MTEKEKMKAGKLYKPNIDKELTNESLIAKKSCYEYNKIKPSDIESRKKSLKK